MRGLAGIKSNLNFDFNDITELKRYLLLFDTIGIVDLSKRIEKVREKHPHICDTRLVTDELELLTEQKLVHDIKLKGHAPVRKGNSTSDNIKTFYQLLENVQKLFADNTADNEQKFDAFTRLHCFIMSIEDSDFAFEPIPLVRQVNLPGSVSAQKSDVINLVIEEFPFPDEQIPWEKIKDFRNDSDNHGQLSGLRTWINSLSKSGLAINEINDELEYKLHQFKKSLEAHKIKFKTGIFETFVVGGAELTENLLKLRLKELTKSLFKARELKADLLIAELNSPGHELGYIYKVNQEFGDK